MRKLLPVAEMTDQMDPIEDLDWWIEAMEQRGRVAADICTAATYLYLSGIAVVNEGADWVFTINELIEGNWEASIGFLPFASGTMGNTGRVLVRGNNGVVLASFPRQIANAVRQAQQLPHTIAARYPVLQQAGATRAQMRALVKGGQLPAPTDHGALRRAMLETDPPPTGVFRDSPQLHHELPWGIRLEDELKSRHIFAEFGLDVNDPQFGKWVEPELHAGWSNGANSWTEGWRNFLENDLSGVTDLNLGRQMILDKLEEMRAGYLDGRFPLQF